MGEAITFSRGIRRLPGLAGLLGVDGVRLALWPSAVRISPGDLVLGRGTKGNTWRARSFAFRHGLPYLNLEDGFLRSVGLGVNGAPPYSLIFDDVGIYYDARRPSRLEHLLNSQALPALPGGNPVPVDPDALDAPALLERARRCMAQIVAERLSKYNSSPERPLPLCDRRRILVVDQTAGDQSITGGLAGPGTFVRMLDAARREHPYAEILIKAHPDVRSGHKRGHFGVADTDYRTRLLTEDINPIHLLEQVDHVYVVTSQLGFEALLVGRPVTCFGVPFYAGWGLTDDRQPAPRRTRPRTLEQVFAAAYLLYARYLDPDLGSPCELERVIEHLALQRTWFARNAGTWLGYGISWWKRWYVRRYLYSPWNRVHFYRRAAAIPSSLDPADTRILVWGMRDTPALRARAAACGYPVWRMEDGFLRSVGLGTDFTTPLSQVIDGSGLYFNPRQPSDLEALLATAQFDERDLTRASALRQRLLDTRLSKYNLGLCDQPLVHRAQPGQRIVLVPGQVEQDAAVRLGCIDIASDAELVAAVRRACPDAYIVYKPHPDVVSGNRAASRMRPSTADYDQLIEDASLATCLDAADEVHTMTSLVGFEALLRSKRVVTYGLPFYAGWGLTEDRHALPRRSRRLALDELVAGVLLHYPRYVSDTSGEFTRAEWAVERLVMITPATRPLQNNMLGRFVRTLRAFIRGVLRELRTSWQG
jgi:capsular polysaccharide export protein